jgi:hypothetical protein
MVPDATRAGLQSREGGFAGQPEERLAEVVNLQTAC